MALIAASHDEYFCSILNLIPPNLYFQKEEDDESWKQSKFSKNIKASAPKQSIKEASKKGKKTKFDPANHKTNEERALDRAQAAAVKRQQERENMQIDESGEDDEGGESGSDSIDDDGDENNDDSESSDESSNDSDNGVSSKKRKLGDGARRDESCGGAPRMAAAPMDTVPTSATAKASAIESLSVRLQARIQELKALRKADEKSNGAASADAKPPSTSSERRKRKRKEKREAKKAKKNKDKVRNKSAEGSTSNKSSGSSSSTALSATVSNTAPSAAMSVTPLVAEDSGNVQFGALIGLGGPKKEKKEKLPSLLAKAEANQARMEELKKTNQAEFLNVQWRDATSRAAGYKIADDPAALRKALKKKAKQKLASAEAWAARVKEVDESKKSKQELRNANLAARREGKPTRPKLKLSQNRAGFEGKSGSDFLNKKKSPGTAVNKEHRGKDLNSTNSVKAK